MSDEPTQIPVDAPAPDAEKRVDIVSPEPQGAATSEPASTPPAAEEEPSGAAGVVEQRPELVVAGAFAGAFVFAKLLQRIGTR